MPVSTTERVKDPWPAQVSSAPKAFQRHFSKHTFAQLSLFFGKVLYTLGFLIHGFWAGRKSLIFGVWAVPAAPKAIPEDRGLRPHLLAWLLWPPGPPRSPNIDDLRPAQKPCIQNQSV